MLDDVIAVYIILLSWKIILSLSLYQHNHLWTLDQKTFLGVGDDMPKVSVYIQTLLTDKPCREV